MISIFITFTVLSCSMQTNLEEFVEEGLSLVRITSSSYSQDYNNQGIVENRSVLSGSPVTVSLEILNPEGLDLVYEIGYNTNYIDGAPSTIAPTGPGQNSVSFTFTPSGDADNQTIVFTIAIRSPSLNKTFKGRTVSVPCVSASNTDIRLQVTLGDQNATYTFSGNGQSPAIMDLTTAGTLNIIPTAEVSGQTFSFNLEANGSSLGSGLILSGEERSLTLLVDDTYTLSITVTAPDTITHRTYTIKVPKGFTVIPGGPYDIADFTSAINASSRIKLGGDINLTGVADGPLISSGDPNLYFDGDGHKISDLRINATTLDAAFIDTNQGTIKNLVLENVTITSSKNSAIVSGLVDRNYGSIFRCSVSGRINATNDPIVGGLVGATYAGSYIAESYSTASVEGTMSVGGLVGISNHGTILNCYARGPVAGSMEVGGLVGALYGDSIVRNSYSTDPISSALIGGPYSDAPPMDSFYATSPTSVPATWNITNALNPSYVWGVGSGINEGYPYLQYFGAQTRLPPP